MIKKAAISILLIGMFTTNSYALEVCNDNGGGGWALPATANPGTGQPGVTVNVPITFTVPAAAIVIDVDTSLDLSYTYMGDMRADLISPANTTVRLFDRPQVADGQANHVGPWGCGGDNMDATFDDESPNGTVEAAGCAGNPVYSGTYIPHNVPATNLLSNMDGETVNGLWTVSVEDAVYIDAGTVNEACVDIQYLHATFDKWVSTNATCTDQIDNLSISDGDSFYYCYTVTNDGTTTFTINAGDATDDQGINISGLEGTYLPTQTVTVIEGPLIGGTDVPIGSTVNIADIIATSDDATYPSTLTLSTDETATVVVTGIPDYTVTKTVSIIEDPVNGTSNPKAIPGAIVEYRINVENTGAGSADVDSVVVTDSLPADMILLLDSPLAPIQFVNGGVSSGLSLVSTDVGNNLATLALGGDQVNLSNNAGGSYLAAGAISSDADNFDTTSPAINFFQVRLAGTFAAASGGSNPSFELVFRMKKE